MGTVFEDLNAINVNGKTEKKKAGSTELTYLSWTFAWEEVKKRYPEAHYEIVMHNGLPYVYDENTGYMVFTNVTIDGITHMMWLPVMDSNNRAMKSKPYQLTFKSGKSIEIESATMFDINKTIMRCLVKNLAMFGLGLYIYAGEDIPTQEKEEAEAKIEADLQAKWIERIDSIKKLLNDNEIEFDFVCSLYKVKTIDDLDEKKCVNIEKHIEDLKKKQEESK